MRILVVEDERRFAEAVRRGLIEGGFSVDVVHTGTDGLWAATETAYDAIVLDIMLPELSGYRVLERLRAAENWCPVLMLTAKDGEYDEADAFDLGADDYLTKPFSFVVLMARLHALIRRGAPPKPPALNVGELVLDPAVHRVRRGPVEITLTPREFGLLGYFMNRPDAILSRKEILAAVWDPAFDGDSNVVEVYVRYLRLKIDVPFGTHSLQTVRGLGYRLASSGG